MRRYVPEAAGSSFCDAPMERHIRTGSSCGKSFLFFSAPVTPDCRSYEQQFALGVSGQNTHEGAAFEGTEREPIELLKEEVGLSVQFPLELPRTVTHDSFNSRYFPAIETFFSLRSHLPVSPLSIVVDGGVSPGADTRTTLSRASFSMPILRSLGGSAVISHSYERAYGAARVARGAGLSPDVLCLQREERRGPRRGSGVGSSFDSACLPVFLLIDRSSSPAVHPVITPGSHRCVAFAFGIPRFLGTRSRTLWSSLSLLFSPVCKTVVG